MFVIADKQFSSPFILAPLAGYSDLPFRLLCRRFGAGYCVSEMISCHGLAYGQEKTIAMLQSVDDERPFAFQLFGSDPYVMAKAADILNEYKPDLVDINMGCPVKKVTKKGAGAALMAEPGVAEKIIREVIKNSQAHVTVKIRRGVNFSTLNCVAFAKMVEESGASAVAIHGRTWSQGFTGLADWQCVSAVKDALSIPVIGNGDIASYGDGKEKLRKFGCDAVMIGRGALGNPWIFNQAGRPSSIPTIAKTSLKHLQLIELHCNTVRNVGAIKNHIGRYFRDLHGSSFIRKTIFDCTSFVEIMDVVKSLSEEESSNAPIEEND